MQPKVSDLVLAIAQVFLASVMGVGFLGSIYVLIFYHGQMDSTTNAMLTGLIGVLGTIVTQQNGYFFQRQRPHTLPDPVDASPLKPPGDPNAPSAPPAPAPLPAAAPSTRAPPPAPIVAGNDAIPAAGGPRPI